VLLQNVDGPAPDLTRSRSKEAIGLRYEDLVDLAPLATGHQVIERGGLVPGFQIESVIDEESVGGVLLIKPWKSRYESPGLKQARKFVFDELELTDDCIFVPLGIA
jgi:hypothetical protein